MDSTALLASVVGSLGLLWSIVMTKGVWINKITAHFSPYVHITIAEYGADRFQRSDMFVAVEAYLSDDSIRARARKLKAEIERGRKKIEISIDDNQEVRDTFRDATLWWHASKVQARSNVIIYHAGDDECRFYRVVFHRRHRDMVLGDYLDHVLEEGRAAIIRNRKHRLFTNNPSSSWNSGTIWSHVEFQHPARFETLAMDATDKETIKGELMAFKEGKDYYSRVGKAWKRGYLLFGPPGTGKSTMIAAMANFLEYDVYDLELTAVNNNSELRKLFIDTTGKSIIVIEDIDCSVDLTGKRKHKHKKKAQKQLNDKTNLPIEPNKDDDTKLTLSGMLNFIDGLWSGCGGERIIIFTTNNKDKLDPALIRRGRMDRHIEMSYCRYEAFKVLANNYLDITEQDFFELFGEIQRPLEEVDLSPADVAENLMSMSTKKDAGACLEGLVEALKNAKQGRVKEAEAKEKEAAEKSMEKEEATLEANNGA